MASQEVYQTLRLRIFCQIAHGQIIPQVQVMLRKWSHLCGPKCVPHTTKTGSQITCMGSRDYRPSPYPDDMVPMHVVDIDTERTTKADGIYLENAHNVTFQQNVIFEFESPRLDWFGDCISIDEYSSVVKGVKGIKCINGV